VHESLPSAAEIAALPADGGDEFNRLIHSASPYLRQHARNPVDWYPWGEEAFARARALDRPIFLSIGYSTCHWCHVMARESFEDPAVAALLDEGFVAVKVDREERPDVDEIYMKTTQLVTGHGGWPNSLWLTPDLRPWYAGTYFPPADRPGRTGFPNLLRHLVRIWREQRAEVEEQANRLAEAVREACGGIEEGAAGAAPGRADVERLLHELRRTYDAVHGGFGSAPKFPPHGSLRILAAEVADSGDEELRGMLASTLDAMLRGGIHDQIGGGFHRYSTDREWLLPHFEKMLYDNAQLLSVLARADRLGVPGASAAAEGIVAWAEREMSAPSGGFFAALDADSEGEEGKCYLWTPAQVDEVLGRARGERFRRAYDVTAEGNFRDEATGERPGTSVPRLLRPLAEVARAEGIPLDALEEELAASRVDLLAARRRRVPPHLDDKVITSWCALFAGALAEAGELLGRPEWVARAERAVEFLVERHRRDGVLVRSSRDGALGPPAFLEDHAALALACLDLAAAGGGERWLAEARRLAAALRERFAHPAGGFYDAAEEHDHLLVRPRDPYDPALPSGNGLAAALFHRLARRFGDAEADAVAEGTLRALAPAMRRAPRGTESLLETVRARAATTASRMGEGGAVRVPWRDGRVRLSLSRLVTAPGGTLEVELDGRFGIEGTWKHGKGAEGPEVRLLAPAGARFRESSRDGQGVRGRIELPATLATGPQSIRFEWRGEPCRAELCLPPVELALEIAVVVER